MNFRSKVERTESQLKSKSSNKNFGEKRVVFSQSQALTRTTPNAILLKVYL